jgi:prepilin-type N-terminal cleavage/methylation domain-containing protein
MFKKKHKLFLFTNHPAFTIIEFLIVIGIIALLATIGMVATHYARSYAKITKAEADLATIAKGIDALALDSRQWPGHQTPYVICQGACESNEIEDLSLPIAGIRQTDGLFPDWNGPYVQILPLDPWGNNYFIDTDYETDQGTKAVVGSYGPNGQGLNDYDDDDIIYIINR